MKKTDEEETNIIDHLTPLGKFLMFNLDPQLGEMIKMLTDKYGDVKYGYVNVANLLAGITNTKIETIIDEWYAYLRNNLVCPECKNNLESYDICECGWKAE